MKHSNITNEITGEFYPRTLKEKAIDVFLFFMVALIVVALLSALADVIFGAEVVTEFISELFV